MKKLIWLVVLLIIFTGCSKPAGNTETASPADSASLKGYMSEPKVLISSGHRYKEESWLGEQVDFRDGSIVLQGDSFHITISFEGNIDEDKLKDAVRVEGYTGTPEATVFHNEEKTVLDLSCRGIEHGKSYRLIVSKSIEDAEGKRLKTDIEKEISLQQDTIALYSFYGAEGVRKNLGIHTLLDAFAVGGMNLSPAPKTVSIDFSAEVDQQSVEQSILDGLKDQGIKCSIKWNGEKSAALELSGFRSGEDEAYAIKLDKAKDALGNPIYGDLYFVVGLANSLGTIDIRSGSDQVLKEFTDKRYMAVQSPSIDKDIIIDGIEAKSVYHIPSQSIREIQADRAYTLGIPGWSFLHSWRNSREIVLLDSIKGSVISYSTDSGTYKELFTLPVNIVKGSIMDIAVSPDGSKLAVAYESNGSHIAMFDLQGKLLYEGKSLYKAKTIDVFGPMADVQWLNHDTVVLEDNMSTEAKQDYNVISINIKTGKKGVIAEHAYKPVVLQGKDLVKIEKFDFSSGEGSIEILKGGKAVGSFETKLNQYDNFFFADEDTMVCNRGNEIVVYHLDTRKSETLGNWYIIGLSEDKSKIYYMTNYKMLYYIP